MRSNWLTKLGTAILTLLFVGVPAFATTQKASVKRTSATRHGSRFSHMRKSSWKRHGQQVISSDRAREIQEALIREHYLAGQPTGVWDTRTNDAMRRFQADQGWQSKVIPDSRALIKLGLGPSHENDLNPDLMGDKSFAPIRGPEAQSPSEIPQR
ncbi:MAG: peptidoglycan-binding protein [Acidobacteria bacterium]|nr:peptidoglycan-binding protein [Acidobacteriota bacterium]MBV9145259.1 peptidoglycan-binding protein [Acidobacteriota bacterium]MBV9436718.1 peptidoglycan-binding protein [Acidobacteriota bacterium]